MSTPSIVGIDLGTTNSCVSLMKNGKPEIIQNYEGSRTTPSIIHIIHDKNGNEKVLVGEKAEQKLLKEPKNTIFNVKRLLGRSYAEVQDYIKKLPFDVVEEKNEIKIQIDSSKYTPSKISSYVLKKLKNSVEKIIKKPVEYAVITVPAYFNHNQREETKKAGEIAGLKVLRVLNEPTSAALNHQISGIIAVYDLGGGTFDISILEKSDNVFEVKSTSGDSFLGGDDVDNVLTDFLINKFNLKEEKDKIILRKLAEQAKKDLSSAENVLIKIPGYEDKTYNLTRKEFESITLPIIEKTVRPCMKALRDAKVQQVDHLVLVGGMTKMPLVREISQKIFKRKPLTTLCPDESVAKGAAIQAAILSGGIKKLLLDVTSLSLGIETVGGLMSTIVKRNSTLPLRKSSIFTTSEDNQQEVIVNIYQGESENVKDNCFLGKIILKDIDKAPKGIPKIEISFEADVNGIYRVTAKDILTGKEQTAEVTGIKTKENEIYDQMKNHTGNPFIKFIKKVFVNNKSIDREKNEKF